jgi:hypothetical protein
MLPSLNAHPRMFKTKPALYLGLILGILFLTACSPAKDEPAAVIGDGSGLPQIFWKVELVGVNSFNPEGVDHRHFIRLFDDGRIVTTQLEETGEKVVVRSADGVWKDVKPPAGQEASYITWYENDANLGGYFYQTPSHGWAMVDGVVHTFTGPPAFVRGRLPDSTLLISTSTSGYFYYQKWKFGPTLQDDLDVHDFFYQDYNSERFFSKLAADGTFLLLTNGGAADVAQGVIREGKAVPLGPEQFHLTDPLMIDREMILPCCRILTIDRVHAGILGIKNGKPVIKNGDVYDKVADEHGEPVAVNGKGDVIYTSTDSKPYHSPRMRFKGKLYQFSFLDWARIAKMKTAYGLGLPTVADMNENGQVLFVVTPVGQGGSKADLYLATPSLETIAPTSVAKLEFTVKSGPGKNLDPINLIEPTLVTGSFSESNLNLSIAVPTTVGGPTRSIFINISGNTQSPFKIDSPLPVKTSLVGTTLVTASTGYSDPTRSLTLVAAAGTLRVKSQTPFGGFTVAFEYIEFTAKDGTVYQLNGEATVQ